MEETIGCFANAIKKLVYSKDTLSSMGKAARLFAEEKFSIESVIKAHIDIYKEALKEK